MNTAILAEPRKLYVSRTILALAGLIAVAIAATILFAPGAFYAGYGINLSGNPTLANELKAPSGMLLVTGLIMFAGVARREWVVPSLATASVVYLSYGVARVISIALDGVPHSGMVSAAVIELVIGAICLAALLSGKRKLLIWTAQR